MKDFNFFSPYIDIKKSSKEKMIHVVLYSALALFVFIGFASWNQYRIWHLQQDILTQEQMLGSAETIQKVKEFQTTSEKVKLLTDYYKILQDANTQLDQIDIVNSGYMKSITDTLPTGTFLSMITFNDGIIQLKGVAESRIAVAELQHNLKALDKITNVHISDITYEDLLGKTFIFNITCELGAVKQNEAKQ